MVVVLVRGGREAIRLSNSQAVQQAASPKEFPVWEWQNCQSSWRLRDRASTSCRAEGDDVSGWRYRRLTWVKPDALYCQELIVEMQAKRTGILSLRDHAEPGHNTVGEQRNLDILNLSLQDMAIKKPFAEEGLSSSI